MDTDVNPPAPQSIAFHGPLGSYISLAIVNLLLSIVTLGIYRFWARARIRHHLWEHTTFAGEPLEYRGKGIELLIGAILGLIIILIPYAVIQFVAAAMTASGHPVIAGLLVLVIVLGMYYLIGVGLYRSERYMLSRTSWRGIRGGMTTGGWAYGWLYFRLQLLRAITLGFATPYVSTRLWNARMNDAVFGSAQVRATAEWRPLFGRFVLALIGSIVVYVIALGFLRGSFMAMGNMVTPDEKPDIHILLPMLGKIYGTLFVAALLVGLVMLSYHAAYWRQVFGSTRLNTLGLEFNATAGNWFGFYFGNLLIVVLTLGLGLMVMPWRAWSFYLGHIRTVGTLDTDSLFQTELAAPTQGDGIADAIGFSLTPF
jgi:uncharacterized membrane protein YjgN (DUF898 family)